MRRFLVSFVCGAAIAVVGCGDSGASNGGGSSGVGGTTGTGGNAGGTVDLMGAPLGKVVDFSGSCAVLEGGEVVCFRASRNYPAPRDDLQGLDFSTDSQDRTAILIPIPHPAVAIASTNGGETACAIVEEPTQDEDEAIRRVWCWGRSALGDGTNDERAEPSRVSGLFNVDRLVGSSEDGTFCAITGTGDLLCWGEPQALPGFGSSDDDLLEPIQVEVPGNVVDMSFSERGICVLLSIGDVHCYDVDPWTSLERGTWVRLPDVNSADALRGSCVLEGGRALCWEVDAVVDDDWSPIATELPFTINTAGYFPLEGVVDIIVNESNLGEMFVLTSDGRFWTRDDPPIAVQLPCDLTGGQPLTLSRIVDNSWWDFMFLSAEGVLVGGGFIASCDSNIGYACDPGSLVKFVNQYYNDIDEEKVFRSDIDPGSVLARPECVEGVGCDCANRVNICDAPPDACL